MKKYVTARKDVWAGILVKPLNVVNNKDSSNSEDNLDDDGVNPKVLDFKDSGRMVCRGMLFNISKAGVASDLMYTTPLDYYVEGIKPQIEISKEFIIEEYANLNELLEYLKYGKQLTQDDLRKIYRKLLVHRWWLDRHIELFGFRDLGNGVYTRGGTETLPTNSFKVLNDINDMEMVKPHEEEPFYKLIKKIK